MRDVKRRPTGAEIIAFPIERQAARIARTAAALRCRQGRLADKYWRTECNRLYGRLQVIGIAEPDIMAEIDAFTEAVQAELRRLASEEYAANRDHKPDGAA